MFFDANILIEALLKRQHAELAAGYMRKANGAAAISALTGHQVMYFGAKVVELRILREYLADFTMLALGQADFDWAFANMRNSDFEDALQLAVAINHGYEKFITFDKVLYKAYKNLPTIEVKLAK